MLVKNVSQKILELRSGLKKIQIFPGHSEDVDSSFLLDPEFRGAVEAGLLQLPVKGLVFAPAAPVMEEIPVEPSPEPQEAQEAAPEVSDGEIPAEEPEAAETPKTRAKRKK